jgi:hypothetical protein
MKKLTLNETQISLIGVIATVVLYVMNIIGTGVIVGGDVGHIGTEIPYYGFVAPFLFIVFSALMAYYTKRKSMNDAFKAVYITLLLPFVAYPLALIFGGTPLLIVPMFLCMPIGSLFYYLEDEICNLMGVPTYEANWLMFVIIAVLLIPIIIAPIAYIFTKPKTT